MKKILITIFASFMVMMLSACTLGSMATPKQVVSDFLDKYKNQDSSILTQLDETINNEYTDEDFRSRYRTLMTNQYKNMEYKITDEIIEDNNAVVEAEITVYDYASSIRKSNDYLNSNRDQFTSDNTTTNNNTTTNDNTMNDDNTNESQTDTTDTTGILADFDEDKFTDYKLGQMENVSDTVTYTMEFTLTKVDGMWQMDSLSNADIEKLHGIYLSRD